MNDEKWKIISGTNEAYAISGLGRIKSLPRCVKHYSGSKSRIKERFLKTCISKDGYEYVSLNVNSKRITKKVHRLVAEAFIENKDSKKTVNHINGIKTDNRLENLEWATHSENLSHAYRCLGRKAQRKGKQVIQMTIENNLVRAWPTARKAANSCGFDYSAISKCCLMKKPHHKGFRWIFSI